MILRGHGKVSTTRQCRLLGVHRSALYRQRTPVVTADIEVMRQLDAAYTEHPHMGSRQLTRELRRDGGAINRKRVQRLMRVMGIAAVAPGPHTSRKHPSHAIYPYLMRNLPITRPNQVWQSDITYLPMAKGFMYLVAILDCHSRKVLSWRVSNTMDTDFCTAALEEAIWRYGVPEIMNTDQGAQYTSDAWISLLKSHGIQISMDGRGRALDNVFIERIWRTIKYEYIHLNPADSGEDLKTGLARYLAWYNTLRPHSSLKNQTPDSVYNQRPQPHAA